MTEKELIAIMGKPRLIFLDVDSKLKTRPKAMDSDFKLYNEYLMKNGKKKYRYWNFDFMIDNFCEFVIDKHVVVKKKFYH
jgi:hypothetical protein